MTIAGLCLFETVCSLDNAIINAQVLSTMSERAKRWFLLWGMLFAVFIIRGALPWLIVWATTPSLGPIDALTATFSNDPKILQAIEEAAPDLLMGGGVFLVFLFLHWLFLEDKNYCLRAEPHFMKRGVWFYAVVSIILAIVVWYSMQISNILAFSAVVGSTAFFITHGFKQNAEEGERELISGNMSDVSKVLYLEILDSTFSIDGVIGAFAFTMSVPLIILGNGLGAFVVRELTIRNIDNIQKYLYLKNGAMYSVLFLGIFMILEAFGHEIPKIIAPITTFIIVGYFFYKSTRDKSTVSVCN